MNRVLRSATFRTLVNNAEREEVNSSVHAMQQTTPSPFVEYPVGKRGVVSIAGSRGGQQDRTAIVLTLISTPVYFTIFFSTTVTLDAASKPKETCKQSRRICKCLYIIYNIYAPNRSSYYSMYNKYLCMHECVSQISSPTIIIIYIFTVQNTP